MILNGTASLEKKIDTKERVFMGIGSRRIAPQLTELVVSIPLPDQIVDSGSTESYYDYACDVIIHDRDKKLLNVSCRVDLG